MPHLLFLLLAGAQTSQSVSGARTPPPPPPPVSIPEHHYNAGSRTVHITYTCMDGYRSITMQYDQTPKGRITSLSRNGYLATREVVDKANAVLSYLDYVSALYPQCSSKDDTIAASGRKNKAHAGILIRWSPTEAHMGGVLE